MADTERYRRTGRWWGDLLTRKACLIGVLSLGSSLLITDSIANGSGTFSGGVVTSIISIQAPLYNEDNTPLEDLDYITIFWGPSSGNYVGDTQVIMAPGATNEETINAQWNPGVNSGSFSLYFAATATDLSGNMSGFSNEVQYTFVIEDTTAPAPPILNGINIVITDDQGQRWVPIASTSVIKNRKNGKGRKLVRKTRFHEYKG